jgi:hypothetical protein
MNMLQTELGLVKARFPEYQQVIDLLYRSDPDFKSLCSDLFLCTNMIQGFTLEMEEIKQALVEYQDIVSELEIELSTVIKNVETGN